jgi:hypothetical protein
MVAAPLLVVLLAAALFPVELALALIVAGLILVVRFTGIVPWTVVITDPGGNTDTERYRSLLHAIRRVRGVNGVRQVAVQFSWT